MAKTTNEGEKKLCSSQVVLPNALGRIGPARHACPIEFLDFASFELSRQFLRGAAAGEVLRASVDLGGTITGEHGVGWSKRGFLEYEQGPAVIALQKRLKAAFEPLGTLNPGKIFS